MYYNILTIYPSFFVSAARITYSPLYGLIRRGTRMEIQIHQNDPYHSTIFLCEWCCRRIFLACFEDDVKDDVKENSDADLEAVYNEYLAGWGGGVENEDEGGNVEREEGVWDESEEEEEEWDEEVEEVEDPRFAEGAYQLCGFSDLVAGRVW